MTRILPLVLTLLFVWQSSPTQAFDQGKALADASLKEKAVWLDQLATDSSDETTQILELWLDGELAFWPSGNRLVRGIKEGRSYRLEELVSGEKLGTASSREIDRVKTNNSLRSAIKQVLGARRLASSDKVERLAAIAELKRQPDYAVLPLLRQRETAERDADVSRQLLF